MLGKVEYPRHFDSNAKDLIQKLLQQDRSKRIGNLRGGADDIRKHKWYPKEDKSWKKQKEHLISTGQH